jgi:hypothetical protein
MEKPRLSAGHPKAGARSWAEVLTPPDSPSASLQLVKGAGVEFSQSDYDPARRSEMEVELVDLLERCRETYSSCDCFAAAEA